MTARHQCVAVSPVFLCRHEKRVLLLACAIVLLANLGLFAQPGDRFDRTRPPSLTPSFRPGSSFDEQVDKTSRAPVSGLKTTVEVTILVTQPGDSIVAQRWAKTFSDLGVQALFRSPRITDEPGVTEQTRGTLRSVKVVGQTTDGGQLLLDGELYTPEEVRRLKEWMDNLKTYGALGKPHGKPLWGLTSQQFSDIYQSLQTPVSDELEDLTVREALSKLPLPDKYPLKIRLAADQTLDTQAPTPIENRVGGLSCGTALAAILSESNLGFFPERTPDGGLELHVVPRSKKVQTWPVGWDLLEGVDHATLMPMLHKFNQIGFEKVAIQDVLDATAAAIEVPILVDYQATRAVNVDLDATEVSYPSKRTTWSLMMNTVIRKKQLTREVRIDEAGKAFLYVFPFVPTPVKR